MIDTPFSFLQALNLQARLGMKTHTHTQKKIKQQSPLFHVFYSFFERACASKALSSVVAKFSEKVIRKIKFPAAKP